MLRDFGIAICRFKDYPVFLNNRKRRIIGFGILFVLLYLLLTVGVPLLRFHLSYGGIGRLIRDDIPDFELSGGQLWVEEPVEIDESGTLILIDTSPGFLLESAGEMEKQLGSWQKAVLMDSEKMIVKNDNEVTEIYFGTLGVEITKESAANYLAPFVLAFGIALLLLGYVLLTLLFFFGALITALLGMIVASCTKTCLSFGQIYMLAVYSRSLPLLIKAALSLLSIRIPYFFILNYGISLFILYLAFNATKNRGGTENDPMEFHVDEAGRYLPTGETGSSGWRPNQEE